jgi:hypothetical protein
MARRLQDLAGEVYGRLTVIAEASRNKWNQRQWRCRCSCSAGTIRIVPHSALRSGNTRSCGCLQQETARKTVLGRTKHGHARKSGESPEYGVWLNMLRRCYDPANKRFNRYGGRGIRVFDAWCDDFSAFLAHVGPRPDPSYTLDRIDNDGGYEPGNVQWVDMTTQARNRSNNRMLTYQERKQTLIEWSEETGIDRTTITARIDRLGWSVQRALTTPVRGRP